MTRAQIQKTLLLAILGVVYGAVKILLPDFPIDQGLFVTLVIYVLAKLGVDVVEARVVAFLAKLGFLK